jgi:hypothetical protein
MLDDDDRTVKGREAMNLRRQDFLLLAMLAAASTPASGQTAAPAAGPTDSAPQAPSIPNFSGIWGQPYLFPGFASPPTGHGPLANTSRRRQIYGVDGPLAPGEEGALAANNNQLVADYTDPILKPHAAAAVKKHSEIELSGHAAPTPGNQCFPEPVPYIFWNFGILVLQQPNQITILYDEDHQVRRVRMNKSHPAQVMPSWYGDSVGHYEGDTLVIDTVGIKADRPFAMLDTYGTPYSHALHVIERYRLLDYEAAKAGQAHAWRELYRLPGPGEGWSPDPNYKGKGLELLFTIEDDGVFTAPWSGVVTYRRPLATTWPELVCADNRREYYAGKETAVPTAEKPDF